MMNCTIDEGILTVVLPERMDSTVAVAVGEELRQMVELIKHDGVVLDGRDVTYIASSGLRVLLTLAKREKDFQVIGLRPEVYNVFEMSGFNKLMTVRKALRQVDLEGCEVMGYGAYSMLYRISPEEVVKVFYADVDPMLIDRELFLSKEAFLLGVPTSICYDKVDCGDGRKGIVYETLNSRPVGDLVEENPARIPELAAKMGKALRELHAKNGAKGVFHSMKERYRKELRTLDKLYTREEYDMLKQFIEAIPEGKALLHGNPHTRNVMIQNGEAVFMDCSEMAYGHPLMDLGSAMLAIWGTEPVEKRDVNQALMHCGMSPENAAAFWHELLANYLGSWDESLISLQHRKAKAYMLLRVALLPALKTEYVEKYLDKILVTVRVLFFRNAEELLALIKD